MYITYTSNVNPFTKRYHKENSQRGTCFLFTKWFHKTIPFSHKERFHKCPLLLVTHSLMDFQGRKRRLSYVFPYKIQKKKTYAERQSRRGFSRFGESVAAGGAEFFP